MDRSHPPGADRSRQGPGMQYRRPEVRFKPAQPLHSHPEALPPDGGESSSPSDPMPMRPEHLGYGFDACRRLLLECGFSLVCRVPRTAAGDGPPVKLPGEIARFLFRSVLQIYIGPFLADGLIGRTDNLSVIRQLLPAGGRPSRSFWQLRK